MNKVYHRKGLSMAAVDGPVNSAAEYRILTKVAHPKAVVTPRLVREKTFKHEKIHQRVVESLSRRSDDKEKEKENRNSNKSAISISNRTILFEELQDDERVCVKDLAWYYGKSRVLSSCRKLGYSGDKFSVKELENLHIEIDRSRPELDVARKYLEFKLQEHRCIQRVRQGIQSIEESTQPTEQHSWKTIAEEFPNELEDIRRRIMDAIAADPDLISNEEKGVRPSDKEIGNKISDLVAQHLFRLQQVCKEIQNTNKEYSLSKYKDAEQVLGDWGSNRLVFENLTTARTVLGEVILSLYQNCGKGVLENIDDLRLIKWVLGQCILELAKDCQTENTVLKDLSNISALLEMAAKIRRASSKQKVVFTLEEQRTIQMMQFFILNLPLKFAKENKSELHSKIEDRDIKKMMYHFAVECFRERRAIHFLEQNLLIAEKYLQEILVSRISQLRISKRDVDVIYRKVFLALQSNSEMRRQLTNPIKQIEKIVESLIDEQLSWLAVSERYFVPTVARKAKRLLSDKESSLSNFLRGSHEPIIAYERRLVAWLLSKEDENDLVANDFEFGLQSWAEHQNASEDISVGEAVEQIDRNAFDTLVQAKSNDNFERQLNNNENRIPELESEEGLKDFGMRYIKAYDAALELCRKSFQALNPQPVSDLKLRQLLTDIIGERGLYAVSLMGRLEGLIKELKELKQKDIGTKKRNTLECLERDVDALFNDLSNYKVQLKGHVGRPQHSDHSI